MKLARTLFKIATIGAGLVVTVAVIKEVVDLVREVDESRERLERAIRAAGEAGALEECDDDFS